MHLRGGRRFGSRAVRSRLPQTRRAARRGDGAGGRAGQEEEVAAPDQERAAAVHLPLPTPRSLTEHAVAERSAPALAWLAPKTRRQSSDTPDAQAARRTWRRGDVSTGLRASDPASSLLCSRASSQPALESSRLCTFSARQHEVMTTRGGLDTPPLTPRRRFRGVENRGRIADS